MRIIVDIGHPGHVHLFRNFISIMEKRGNRVLATIRDRENVRKLLDHYQIRYLSLGEHKKTIKGKIGTLFHYNKRLYSISKKFRPDLFLSHGSMYAAHVSALLGKPHISLEDTENSEEQIMLYKPFTDKILTSTCFGMDLGKKQVRYNGYHELAYLHPKYFTPDPGILDLLAVGKNEKFVIMRFVSGSATHDFAYNNLNLGIKRRAIKEFSKYAKIFITSESLLPADLKKYRVKFSPEKMHDALFFATLLYGESATMASEAAVLGTPAIFLDDIGRGYTDEQESEYGLVFNFTRTLEDQIKSIYKGVELLRKQDLKKRWYEKREKLFSDKIELTTFLVDFISNYSPAPNFYKHN